VYELLSTYTALRLSQICGGLGQTRNAIARFWKIKFLNNRLPFTCYPITAWEQIFNVNIIFLIFWALLNGYLKYIKMFLKNVFNFFNFLHIKIKKFL
jgi:hypothetical protein